MKVKNCLFAAIAVSFFALAQLDWRSDQAQVPVKVPDSYFFLQRAYPYGKIDKAALKHGRECFLNNAALSLTSGPTWVPRGPNKIQGRVTSIAVDPRDDDVAYIGAAEGGVFRTGDRGASWTPLFDSMSSLSIGAVALDPEEPDTVFVGTGEVNPGGGSVAYGGTGLYRSQDNGETWTLLGLEQSGSIGRIVVHPSNSNIIHVAVMGELWEAGPDRGIYRTVDGGQTWERTLFVNDTTGCVDIIQRPDDPNVLFAAMWQRIRAPAAFDYGGPACGVYKSEDGGETWNLTGNGLPASSNNLGRIGLAVSQSNPDVMCAIYADRTGFFDGVYRTTDGGDNWNRTNDGQLANVYSSFGWWFGNIRIHPENEDEIFVIGLNVFRSDNGGGSYFQVGANMHVDHHEFAFGSGTDPIIYAGNDGGVYTSVNGLTFLRTPGDLPITQGYRVAVSELNEDALWVGTQDNGTNNDLDGDGQFEFVFGGDGFQPVPHLTDTNRQWAQFQFGNVFFIENNSALNATGGLFGRVNWNAPHAQDPNDPERRYFGTDRVFQNIGNTSWTSISPDLTGGVQQGNQGQVNGTLTTITVSPASSDVIWAGSDDGSVRVTQNRGGLWTDVSTGSILPARWVTSITADPDSPGTALVTFSGFRWNEDVAHIYRTTNFGQDWTAMDGDLPDIPVNDLFIDPLNNNVYFVATDAGVYRSIDAGATWRLFGIGLPNVVVTDFAFQQSTRELVAGTYGRSIFSVAIDDDGVILGDVNQDGIVSLLDVGPFVALITSGSFQVEGDVNKDGTVDLLDVGPFVDLIVGQ